MEHRLRGAEVSEAEMVDNFEEPNQTLASEDVDQGAETDMITYIETPSFAARLRMIILLSLICWALVIGGAVWIAG